MRNQSKIDTEYLERIEVPEDFPVSEPDFNTRNETPDVRPHIHDLFEIGYCYDGSGVFIVGGKMFPFRQGDAVVINTHEVHIAKGSPGETTSWGFLFLDPLRLLAESTGSYSDTIKLSHYCGASFRNIVSGTEHPEITLCIRRILEESRNKPKNYRSMIRSLTWQLLLDLDRYYPVPAQSEEMPDYRDIARIVPALNHIGANYNREIDIPHLAKLCFTSESNFRKLFHKAMGCAPQPYLQKVRLNVAASMLRSTDSSILEIAQICGFRNLSNFNRQFLVRFGMNPRTMREKTPEVRK